MSNELMGISKMTSMEVAEVTGKRHADIMRDIRDEIEKLQIGGINGERKFALSSYITNQNKEMSCYQLSKEGVLQLAARYDAVVRAKLIELAMRQEQKPLCLEDVLIQSLQEMKAVKQQLNEVNHQALTAKQNAQEVKQELQDIRDTIILDTRSWKKDTSNLINKMAAKAGGYQHIEAIRKESYKLFCDRLNVNLEIRLTNIKKEAALNGVTKSRLSKLNYLDAIEKDKRLVEGYVAIVKEMAVKHGLTNNKPA